MSSNNPRVGYDDGTPPSEPPVSDPVQKSQFDSPTPRPALRPDQELFKQPVDPTPKTVRLLTSKVSQLEGGLRAALDGIRDNSILRERHYAEIVQLRTNLMLTIRAIERLAKGKSLGALGLPGEEEWKEVK